VWTATVLDSSAPRALAPASLPESMEPEVCADACAALRFGPAPAHDPSLLLAALDDVEARRAAIEWLADADLLCACLV
jgi:hypothetical protein